jgi:hypothetical protein
MMKMMDGRSYPKSISRAYPTKILLDVSEIILLAGIGAAGVLIHAYLRIPLKLPGHHGVIYMALLLSGRLISKKNFAASLSSIGAAAMLLIPLGFKDPFMPVIYLFPGFIVDIFFNSFKTIRPKVILLALVCGLAYMTIPVTRIFITLSTGFPYGSFITGFFYPLFTHFIFGFAGGLIPAGIQFFTRKKK